MFVGVVLGLHHLFFVAQKKGDKDYLSISLPM